MSVRGLKGEEDRGSPNTRAAHVIIFPGRLRRGLTQVNGAGRALLSDLPPTGSPHLVLRRTRCRLLSLGDADADRLAFGTARPQ